LNRFSGCYYKLSESTFTYATSCKDPEEEDDDGDDDDDDDDDDDEEEEEEEHHSLVGSPTVGFRS
jgi:hypothetical protein